MVWAIIPPSETPTMCALSHSSASSTLMAFHSAEGVRLAATAELA